MAEKVVLSLIDSGINIYHITFLQDLLHTFISNGEKAVLLVPERLSDGTRTYRLIKGSIQLGYVLELWRKIAEDTTENQQTHMH